MKSKQESGPHAGRAAGCACTVAVDSACRAANGGSHAKQQTET